MEEGWIGDKGGVVRRRDRDAIERTGDESSRPIKRLKESDLL